VSPDRMPRSSDAVARLAAVLGFGGRTHYRKPRPRIILPTRVEKPPAREQPMKMSEVSEAGDPERRDPERRAATGPSELLESPKFRGVPSIAPMPPIEEFTPRRSSDSMDILNSFIMGRYPTREPQKQDVEKSREKVAEATANYFARTIGNRIFKATIGRVKSEAFPETAPLDAIEKANNLLQNSVNSPFEALDVALGLSSGEATVGAGITTNLILAPITGPLEKAETYIEVCGIIAGILTGGHGLVVAFVKPLLHSQLNHALSRLAVNLLLGPQTRADRMEQDPAPRTGEGPNDGDSLAVHREVMRDDPLWLCIVFKSKQPPESTLEQPDGSAAKLRKGSDSPDMSTVATPIEGDIPKPTILPVGNYEFVRTLLTVLQDSDVSETDVPTAQAMRTLPAGRHFILRVEGVSFGSSRTTSNSQVGIVCQHPGCLTRQCVPPGGGPCVCSCAVCQKARAQTV
jgi:hypothetical protein